MMADMFHIKLKKKPPKHYCGCGLQAKVFLRKAPDPELLLMHSECYYFTVNYLTHKFQKSH